MNAPLFVPVWLTLFQGNFHHPGSPTIERMYK